VSWVVFYDAEWCALLAVLTLAVAWMLGHTLVAERMGYPCSITGYIKGWLDTGTMTCSSCMSRPRAMSGSSDIGGKRR
jgi:hypothetical protein